jgi:thioredoxin 1
MMMNSNNISGGGGEIEHIDTLTRWSDVFTKSKQQQSKNNNSALLLFVKFTAEWCKPCKVIQPTYIKMAVQYPKEKFVSVDVDGDDCDVLSSKLRVGMMPTFICFRNGVEIGRMSGGNNPENLKSWVEKMTA